MADIFQEVDEALRQDRAREWWKRHGNKAIAAAIAIVLAIAGWNAWNWYQNDQRAKAGAAFSAAVETATADRTASIIALEKLAGGVEPYATLARLKIAQLKAEAGDRAAASTQFAALGGSALSADLRDLAVLLSVMQAFDAADPNDLSARLQPLAGQDRPWRASAREMMAALALKRNDVAAARTIWLELRDDVATPPAMRERAREMVAVLGDGADKKN